jgi:hypothetical protein
VSSELKSDSTKNIARPGLSAVLLALSVVTAAAQAYPPGVIARCARVVERMPELGCDTCDGYRDSMRHACEANGGWLPGEDVRFGRGPFGAGPRW